jgi:anti-sigma factor ChrR (cupin superfamily)
MLTCKEITELVTDYAEGNLSFMDRLRFRMHIGMCRNCRRYVRQVKATAAALLEQELLQRFESWKRTRGS